MGEHVDFLPIRLGLLRSRVNYVIVWAISVKKFVQGRWLVISLLELAHLVELEVVVILARLQALRVLVLIVTWIQALLLRHKLDLLFRIGLLLLLAKEYLHGLFELVYLVDLHSLVLIGFVCSPGHERAASILCKDRSVDKVDQIGG